MTTSRAPVVPGVSPSPRIVVLLATHDAVRLVEAQVQSILDQKGVEVTVVVSDDGSTDGTWELIEGTARADPRVRLLPRRRRFGSAAPNFYHLLLEVDLAQFDAVALADQDDIWFDWKLGHHLELLRENAVGGLLVGAGLLARRAGAGRGEGGRAETV